MKSEVGGVKSGTDNSSSIADLVAMEIGNIGENMQLRRALFYKATNDLQLGSYVYGPAGKYTINFKSWF